MIDDPAMVEKLMGQMEARLPIPAFPTKELAQALRQHGAKLSVNRAVFIQQVLYGGDEGGITCDITPTRDAKVASLVSLTHLRLPPDHPLARDVRAYQRARVRRIARSRP
jgi:hypothetical protein